MVCITPMFENNYNIIGWDIKKSQRQFSCIGSLQQKVSCTPSEFIGCSERGQVKKQWIHWSSEHGLVNCTQIL
jgi:hypothetical protein